MAKKTSGKKLRKSTKIGAVKPLTVLVPTKG